MQRIKLDNWTVKESYPYVLYRYPGRNEIPGQVGLPVKAKVPGSVYGDLLRAGKIENPYYGTNSKNCEWVASRWWLYETEFNSDCFNSEQSDKYLILEGVDNAASVWLNGKMLARFEGSNNPQRIKLDGIEAENRLGIVIESETADDGQMVHTSRVGSVRNRCGYRWDFCLRLVNMGIYGDAYIEECERAYIDGVNVKSEITGTSAKVKTVLEICSSYDFAGEVILTIIKDNDKVFSEKYERNFKKGKGVAEFYFTVDEIELWYPNGYGKQPLYTLLAEVSENGKTIYSKRTLFGFKTLKLVGNEGAPEKMNKFLFEINGKKIYIKGFNYVPIDLMYGEEENDKYEKLLELAKNANCNLIRVWGGGYIASEKFYRICSEKGILVWQDFTQSSSGMDNIPNHDETYRKKLASASRAAVISKRNYPCLALWNGGNELCKDLKFTPLGIDDANSVMLKKIVDEEDADRPFFPTSPFGGNFCLDVTEGENQNIHGNYKYYYGEANLYHNKHYNSSDSLFHAEFGVDGLADLQTLKKILPKKEFKVTDSLRSDVWLHLSNWWNTLDRDEHYFGKINTMEEYVAASQFMQAEGLRYIIDCNRRRALYNSGSIIWELNEPTPNASCTSVIDYYLKPKQAYYAVKSAFQPIAGCVKYDKLDFNMGEKIDLEFYVVNDTDIPEKMHVRIVADEKSTLLDKIVPFMATGGRAQRLFDFSVQNEFENGLRIDMECGEYINSVLILSRGNRGYCNLGYVRAQNLWRE